MARYDKEYKDRVLARLLPPESALVDRGSSEVGVSATTLAEHVKVVDIIHELRTYGVEVFVHDPEADPDEAMHEYGVRLLGWEDLPRADAIVAAVSHRRFDTLGPEDLVRKLVKGGCVIDVKSAFDPAALTLAGLRVWRL